MGFQSTTPTRLLGRPRVWITNDDPFAPLGINALLCISLGTQGEES